MEKKKNGLLFEEMSRAARFREIYRENNIEIIHTV